MEDRSKGSLKRHALCFRFGSRTRISPPSPHGDLFENRASRAAESCHDCQAAVETGGFRVDSRASLLKSGPALIPCDPDQSLLTLGGKTDWLTSSAQGGQLKPQEIQALIEWVKTGAPGDGPGGRLASRFR